jgi:hypothetical protein
MRILRTVAVSIAATAMVAAGTACGGPEAPKAPDNPRSTLVKLVEYIVEDDGEAACKLMTEPVQDTFAADNDALSCEKAVTALSTKVTDKAAFKAMVPNGLKVKGDVADISGYCGEGWSQPDGSKGKLAFSPNGLGKMTLKKIDDGWIISEYKGAKRLSSCGG